MKKFSTIDWKEAEAAHKIITSAYVWQGTLDKKISVSRPLSGYIGSKPYGGTQCMWLESEWARAFNIKHAVAVNSGTSGLLAACMAVGVEHGDEVIVSPYTMSATAAAPKLLGAKLVWADIEADTFCIDPIEVSNLITGRTKAVIATSLFGHPARLHELRAICDSHGVYLIEDNAQAIFAKENDRWTGTIGHIGVFSLNVHKHLQVGEGGICTTNSSELDRKLREAMNHGEMRGGILGLNLRMTEITAAMAREQLKKAPEIMDRRREIAEIITYEVLDKLKGKITPPLTRDNCLHSFYCWAGLLEQDVDAIPEPFHRGYLHPLYSLPVFATKPSTSRITVEEVERKIVLVEICSIDPTDSEIVEMVKDLGREI